MKIAYFTGEYPRATDTFVQREIMGLRRLGVEVATFSVRKPDIEHLVGSEQRAEREQTTYLLPPSVFKLIVSHLWLIFLSPINYFRALKLAINTSQPGIKGFLYQLFYFLEAGLLARYLNQRGITHLHNHIATSSCSVAMLAAAFGLQTFSFTMHGPHIFFEPHRWRLDEKIRRAEFVACISYFCRSQGMIFASTEQWPKMPIIRCGLEMDLFEAVNHHGPGNRLLYVGRLAVEKGLPIVFESLRQLLPKFPDLMLTVVGDGSDRSLLEQLTQDMAIADHVNFVGYQSQSAVREYLRETDIFVLPSFAEGIPVVLMEAMATGVPVVATQIAGVAELVQSGESGYLTPPGDSETLAAAIAKLIPDADHRNQLGRQGRKKVESEFNISQALNELMSWFSAIEENASDRSFTHKKLPTPSTNSV